MNNQERKLLTDGPPLEGHTVRYNAEASTIIIDNTLIKCTKTEYLLLMKLLSQPGHFVPYEELLCVFGGKPGDRSLLWRHINRLRGKIPSFLKIKSEIDEGYVLRLKSSDSVH